MPRIRTIKPDAFLSDTLSSVPREARWTFAGLWTYCDDEGRARYDVRLIKAALYPLDDTVTLAILSGDLDELERAGSICRYDAAGKRYLHIPAWREHQKINRPSPSKLPACTSEHEESAHTPESSLSPHGTLPEDSRGERKGKERNREASERAARVSAHGERFADFWATYPKKVDRGHAEKAWTKIGKNGADTQAVIDAAAAFAAKVKGSDPKFIPYAATWLNGERWLDEDPQATLPDAGPRETFQLPTPPPEIADDPAAYQRWVHDQRAAWDAQRAGATR